MTNYHLLDHPAILHHAFYPRPGLSPCPPEAFDLNLEAADNVSLHCRFYAGGSDFPTILYFHGNGELVSDYDGIAPFYHEDAGANLAAAEFRGYGAAGGRPTFSDTLADARLYLKAVRKELARRHFSPNLFVMGRSLGSVPALELAASDAEQAGDEGGSAGLAGLIIESGFACVTHVSRSLGFAAPPEEVGPLEEECREKAQSITLPTLLLHGEWDTLVPPAEAERLYSFLGTTDKELIVIPRANHNNIIFEGKAEYFSAIQRFISRFCC